MKARKAYFRTLKRVPLRLSLLRCRNGLWLALLKRLAMQTAHAYDAQQALPLSTTPI
ncbi:hypothetical protein GCM10011410_11260 [Hoyosella rhizosphaerae]|uniref:Uncharacterized protein n=1 Tax=Hoyosella rhizosphaerae TaxID=1755582 RepID=A0A916XBY9_9ACTN|nr:hypothetical protein GCM10011410_11260 [Hoyosella rhizosphaerae]